MSIQDHHDPDWYNAETGRWDKAEPAMSADVEQKMAVVTITCRKCGRVLKQTAPRVADPEEIEAEEYCSPAFGQASCPEHPPAPPRANMTYAPGEAPLLWTVRLIPIPGGRR